jgi:RNA polymerase-binding transcription factor DksA
MTMARARTGTRANARAPQRTRALSPARLRELEAELIAEQARLERSLGAAATAEHVVPLVLDSDGSVPSGDPDGNLRGALHERVRARHDAIGAALQRLADGTYGRCVGCGQHIPFGRLVVMPESERCVACGPLG